MAAFRAVEALTRDYLSGVRSCRELSLARALSNNR